MFRGFFLSKSEKIKKLFRDVTTEKNVIFIELFTTTKNNLFTEDPETYYSCDGLHPSDLGYWIWYKKMWEVIREKKVNILNSIQ